MKEISTVDDIYPAMEELIVELRSAGHLNLADILHHRMHQVAWTARSELFEELQNVLAEALHTIGSDLPQTLRSQIHDALQIMGHYLENMIG